MRQIEPAATRFFNNAGWPRNSEAGLTVHDLSAPRTMAGAERRRFLRSRPCLAAVRLTAVVLVLAAASLVLVRPAFAADEETFWSATLNVQKIVTLVWGCQIGGASICSDSSVLSDNYFTLSGVTYEITEVVYGTRVDFPEFFFRVVPPPPEHAFDALRIHAGATAFDFADAFSSSNSSSTSYSWDATLDWSVGDDIPVRITGSGVTPTLEPFRTPVERGDSLSFRFDLKLSERVWVPFADMRDHAFDVTNGTIVKAMRVDLKSRYHKGRWRSFSDHWRMTVEATDTDTRMSPSRSRGRRAASEARSVRATVHGSSWGRLSTSRRPCTPASRSRTRPGRSPTATSSSTSRCRTPRTSTWRSTSRPLTKERPPWGRTTGRWTAGSSSCPARPARRCTSR